MHRVLNHMATQHDWGMTLLASCVCVAGVATALVLLGMARGASPAARRAFALSATVVSGLAVWAAHFIAMLGYRSDLTIRYDVLLTVISLAIVLLGFSAGIAMTMTVRGRTGRMIASLGAGASVVVMQFVGTAALRVDGARIVWDPMVVFLAIATSLLLAVAAALPHRMAPSRRVPLVALLATASVTSLHFGATSAMTFLPDSTVATASGAMSGDLLLVFLVGGVSIVMAVAAFLTGTAYWSRTTALGQLREAIAAMPDGMGFFDADDRLVVWNARYAELNPELASSLSAGLTFEDIIRIGLAENLYADAAGREDAWLAERCASRDQLSNTIEQRISGDRWLRVQDRRTDAGGIVTVCTDITDLKHNARALAEARDAAEAANRAKSEFLANMSHEIRTPLNGVIGLAQALVRTELNSNQREMLDLIQSSGQTLQTLLSDILDLARIESGRVDVADEPFDLSRAVQDAAQLYATAASDKGLQFFVDIDPDAAIWARGDGVRLKQILTNLVSNAVKFTAQGFVSLTVSRGVTPGGSPILRFTVEDTGVGFDAAARERLFTRFEQADGTITRRYGGTGLGLAICRKLAEMMNGDLDCESEPDGGSAFILTLPLTEVEAPLAIGDIEPADRAEPEARRIRVLLADDHPTNRRVVELILALAPVDLTSVEDGAQALAACRAAAYDLVLMDMQMPVMDGLTATREIRLHETAMGFDRTPIVMLTANALPDHVAAGRAAGADRHLAKPFNAADLLGLVDELGGRNQDDSPRRLTGVTRSRARPR